MPFLCGHINARVRSQEGAQLQPCTVVCAFQAACTFIGTRAAGLLDAVAALEPMNAVVTNCSLIEPHYRAREKHGLHMTLPDAVAESQQLCKKFKVC